jgi:hypothetical protein
MKRGLVFRKYRVRRLRTRRKRYGRQWRRPTIAAGFEPHDRRFRSRRSIGRSPDRQSCRRDGSRRQSCPPRARQRCCHSAPRIARGCIGDPDQPQPDCACTSHTRRQAFPHPRAHSSYSHKLGACTPGAHSLSSQSSKTRIRKRNSVPHLHEHSADNDGGWNNAYNGDDEFAPPRSSQMQTAMHPRQRLYAYYLPSCCFGGFKDRDAIEGRVISGDHPAAASTMGVPAAHQGQPP